MINILNFLFLYCKTPLNIPEIYEFLRNLCSLVSKADHRKKQLDKITKMMKKFNQKRLSDVDLRIINGMFHHSYFRNFPNPTPARPHQLQ